MDLLRTLTNQEFAGAADQLANRLKSPPAGRLPERGEVHQERARHGSVARAVRDAVCLMRGSWTLSELQAEIELELAAPVSYGSIKAAVAKLAAGSTPEVQRLERGRYLQFDADRDR